ncbi:HCLS1-associated protein X-1 [Onychostruthus taczanowskii]|uniref:HCLS1-associated protein X-1 n=1 Tax=Onychostruthus taczanowskii TaxID=356909 RepID=UPI001B8020BE|nr:HCLS1-associated protein X-1 [Onychostruthus taczanowskii]XP_041253263.1 HCLS1-associated protein X-1 [Onychostruthus taczanowskii]
MSFYDVFRGFFGFPGRCRPRDPLFGGAAWDEEDEEEDGGPSMSQPPQDFGFGFSPGSSRGAFEELFRDMGELLGVLGGFWAEPQQPFEPALPGPGEGSARRPLRDSMLKHPESPPASAAPGSSGDLARPWRPFLGLEDAPRAPPSLKEDQDLDSQVSSAGLGTILRPNEPESHSYFQSVSVTKVTLPDGGVEERRTVQDSQGRRETTVTRRRGDQAFITTTKEDGHKRDYREEVVNMDDRELAQFAGTWPQQELPAADPGDPSSVLGSFLRRWFSSW